VLTRRGLSVSTKPTAQAPRRTAASTSVARVRPQILTKLTPAPR
jgi:hypothetical protein